MKQPMKKGSFVPKIVPGMTDDIKLLSEFFSNSHLTFYECSNLRNNNHRVLKIYE